MKLSVLLAILAGQDPECEVEALVKTAHWEYTEPDSMGNGGGSYEVESADWSGTFCIGVTEEGVIRVGVGELYDDNEDDAVTLLSQ